MYFFSSLMDPNRDPGFIIFNIPLFGFIFILFILGVIRLIGNIQGIFGVRRYVFDGRSIMVPHALGRTKIPIDSIEEVDVDQLLRKVVKQPKFRGGMSTTIYDVDSAGNSVRTFSGILPYCYAPLASVSGGSCLLVKLRGKDERVALTPESPEDLAKAINEVLGVPSST
jgi:hypothetical protein